MKHNLRQVIGTFLVLLVGLFLGSNLYADKPIRILAAYNLTGPDAAFDKPSLNGAELAVDQINKAGGVLGRPLELIPVDTGSDLKTSAETVRKALEANRDIAAGIGFSDSSYVLAAGPLFQQAGIPFITSGATDPKLPREIGDNLFLAPYGDNVQARAMAVFAYQQLKLRRIAVWIDDERDYTKTVGNDFIQSFQSLGGQADKQTFPHQATDFSKLIKSFKLARPPFQAIYAASVPGATIPLIKQVRDAGIPVPLLSGDGWDDPALFKGSQEMKFSNLYFTTHHFFGVETPAMKDFKQAFQTKYGSPPKSAFAALGYDTVHLVASAIRRAASAKPADIRKTLAKTTDFQGVVGVIAYTSQDRVPTKPVAVIGLDAGKEKLVWTWRPETAPRKKE